MAESSALMKSASITVVAGFRSTAITRLAPGSEHDVLPYQGRTVGCEQPRTSRLFSALCLRVVLPAPSPSCAVPVPSAVSS